MSRLAADRQELRIVRIVVHSRAYDPVMQVNGLVSLIIELDVTRECATDNRCHNDVRRGTWRRRLSNRYGRRCYGVSWLYG